MKKLKKESKEVLKERTYWINFTSKLMIIFRRHLQELKKYDNNL